MDKEDARTQPREVLHERRKQVIRMHRKGIGVMKIVEQTGLSWSAVDVALRLYESGGAAALKPDARGKKRGSGRSLSADQELSIQRTICDQRPEQLKMDFALWSRAAVMQLIEREHGIKLSVRAVGNYLARWGFTPQKPIKKAYEQRPEAVQAWLDETYPGIETRAKTEGAEIHWGDETALVNTDVRGRSYAPAGKTPVTYAVGGTRQKLSMIATVTNQGKTRWMIIDEAFNSDKLIEFLEALIKDAGKKVFLILDNLRVHHSKPVKAWVEERRDKIELFYLPSYSPELNPEERLNADLKHAIGSKVPARTKAKLKAAAVDHMTMLDTSRAGDDGLKHSGDETDAAHLAHMLRLGILPTGYIHLPAERALRDLARKRIQLVRSRTQHVLAIENILARQTGACLGTGAIKRWAASDVDTLGLPADVALAMKSNVAVINALNLEIGRLESRLLEGVKLRPEYARLKSIPGIGDVLATIIMLETGDIARFAQVGNFASYARCVDSARYSNGKKKGEGNTKNGNAYLVWAFVEAANFARRYSDDAKRFFERKKARTNSIVATKALAHKLARASYHMLKAGQDST